MARGRMQEFLAQCIELNGELPLSPRGQRVAGSSKNLRLLNCLVFARVTDLDSDRDPLR